MRKQASFIGRSSERERPPAQKQLQGALPRPSVKWMLGALPPALKQLWGALPPPAVKRLLGAAVQLPAVRQLLGAVPPCALQLQSPWQLATEAAAVQVTGFRLSWSGAT